MKKVFLILAFVSIFVMGCNPRTTQKENQAQDVAQGMELIRATICQSCAMPMDSNDLFGTDADGAANSDYCKYCYANGEFLAPDITMDGMIEVCVPFMVEQGMEEEIARGFLQEALPQLKRWQSNFCSGQTH